MTSLAAQRAVFRAFLERLVGVLAGATDLPPKPLSIDADSIATCRSAGSRNLN
jgi:hypothetical protein